LATKRKSSVKVLEIYIDGKLSWETHRKLKGLTSGIWIMANKLNKEMKIRILSAPIAIFGLGLGLENFLSKSYIFSFCV